MSLNPIFSIMNAYFSTINCIMNSLIMSLSYLTRLFLHFLFKSLFAHDISVLAKILMYFYRFFIIYDDYLLTIYVDYLLTIYVDYLLYFF
jgi:hypothetical protein